MAHFGNLAKRLNVNLNINVYLESGCVIRLELNFERMN